MHDVAWRGMSICVRSKDAQKQLARTSLKLPSRSEKIQISREYDTLGWISQSKQSIPISDWRAEPLSFHL